MNRKDITILALRITALYFLILTLAQLAPFLSALSTLFFSHDVSDFGNKAFLLAEIPALIVYLLAAGGFWRYAPKLAEWILPGPSPQPPEPGAIDLHEVEMFCVSLLGLFILATTLPLLVKIIFASLLPHLDSSYQKMLELTQPGRQKTFIPYSDILSLAVKLAIGSWFTFGPKGILGLITKVRKLGRTSS